MSLRPFATAALCAVVVSLGACQDGGLYGAGGSTRHLTPIPQKTLALMQTKGVSQNDPILIRTFKKEAELEVWKRNAQGQYALLKTYPICRWSGQLGPKVKQGDRQAPEGFYSITPGQMNPNSAYYLSFDVGYPNAFDRANGRTGNHIMVHGTCSSSGCFAMTDESMSELYAVAREAFAGGQRSIQFQSYPFRMTATNLAKFRNDPHLPFWRNLKEGSDHFETLREEPRVAACGTRYAFGGADAAGCTPRVDPQVAEKRTRDDQAIAELVAKGTPAVRTVYEDGDQNPVFRKQAPQLAFASLTESEADQPYSAKDYARHALGEVSRPDSLAAGPREVTVDPEAKPATAVASAKGSQPSRKTAPNPVAVALQGHDVAPAKPAPARIEVADAEGDPGAYRKLLGNLFGNTATSPAAGREGGPSVAEAPTRTEVAVTTTVPAKVTPLHSPAASPPPVREIKR